MFEFLGDSVDSRLSANSRAFCSLICFWGIVWTAGQRRADFVTETLSSFWGIVWTAGIDLTVTPTTVEAVFGG